MSGTSRRNRVFALTGIAVLLTGICVAVYYLGASRNASRQNSNAAVNLLSSDVEDANAPARPIATSTLQDAIAAGLVTAEFSGNGGSSGDSVRVRLAKGANFRPGPLEAVLPAGSVLMSRDASAQSMMVAGVRGIDLDGSRFRPESRIVLNDGEAVAYVLAAYCIQFEKQNPTSSTRFALERPNPVLACIARKGTTLTVPGMQAAVWMQTDKITYARMVQKFSVTAQDWTAGQSVFQECRDVTRAPAPATP